ncbi:MAG: hypothetical protein ACKOBS_01825 [Verrucomicrobiota bacterium]
MSANTVQLLTAKPLKFTVLPKEGNVSNPAAAGESKAAPSSRLKFRYGRTKEGLDSTSIGLGQFELGNETVKSGVPLMFSIQVNLSKGRTFPESADGGVPPLNYAWIIYRLGTKNGVKSRTYLTHLTVGIGRSQWSELSQKGELLLKSEIETVGMQPGNYGLSLRFWQTGQTPADAMKTMSLPPGFQLPPFPFKVVK